MVESLEQLFETLEDFSNSIYIKAAEIKSMLISKLDSEKQSDFLINYAKSIDLSNSYAKVFSELNKCLAFSDSDYSKKYDYFKKSGQTHKIERMEKLIRKNIPLDNINSCLMDIELGAKNENPFLPIIWNEKNCIGGCGYAGNYIKTNEGLYVCPDCAVIQENDVFVSTPKRAYSKEEIENRRTHEVVGKNFGPRTVILKHSIDFKGSKLNSKNNISFYRLAKIQRAKNSLERNYLEAMPMLKHLCSILNLNDNIKENAWMIYSLVAKQKLTRGRSIEGFLIASIYASARINNIPKDLEEIISISNFNRKKIIHHLRIINNDILPQLNMRYKPLKIQDLIPKFGNDMEVSTKFQIKALNILNNALNNKMNTQGKDPKSYAAAALYIALKNSDESKSQEIISKFANITTVTLRARINDIKHKLN